MGDICGNRRTSPGFPADISRKFYYWIKNLKKNKIDIDSCIRQLKDISRKKKQKIIQERKKEIERWAYSVPIW